MAERLDDLIADIHRAAGGTPPPAPPRPAPRLRPAPRRPMPPPPVRRGHRWMWALLAVVLTASLVAAAVLLIDPAREGAGPEGVPGGWTSEQRVVVWSVWDPRDEEIGLAIVLGSGGGPPPIALAIPWYTEANIPGYGLGTIGEAVDLRKADVAAGAVQNLLGVQADGWGGTSTVDLATAVDATGGIEVEGRVIRGDALLTYVRRTIGDEDTAGELRFIRWLEVVGGLLRAAGESPDALAGLPPDVVAGLEAARDTDVVELPVDPIGSGLAEADPVALERLLSERFVSEAAVDVRLVVLNGNGIPGVGYRVAEILNAAGFDNVASGNTPEFDVEVTKIVAGDSSFLDEARLARDLLGMGEVAVSDFPTGVADVTVIVGMDFGGS